MSDPCERTDQPRSQFQTKLANAELNGLKLLSEALDAYDAKSEEDFAFVIDSVLANRFSQSELATEFKVSVGTVSRWSNGRSCPPEYARQVIVNRLRDMLVASLGRRRPLLTAVREAV